ncbi:hypothetical protein D3C76_1112100 [compost metagenome]
MDKVEVVPARPFHGEGGRGGEADQGGQAGTHRLVDKFQAAAAGDHGESGAGVEAFPQQGADQLVQGVMAADVFTTQAHLA